MNEITVLDIEMFYTHEINQRGVSGNTVLHYHANIRKALSDAAKLKLIPYNPAAEVERPKKDNFVASYYSADELMEVLPIFANTKMELPVMLAAFYGLRRSEVIGLQWSAIDFERKIVTISRTFERINVDGKMVDVSKCRTKNKASFRSLPLIPAVEQALLKAQKCQHHHDHQNRPHDAGRFFLLLHLAMAPLLHFTVIIFLVFRAERATLIAVGEHFPAFITLDQTHAFHSLQRTYS